MSSMKYTYKATANAIALKNIVQGKAISVQKGKDFKVDVYELLVSGRGNPEGTKTKVYFFNSTKKNTMGMQPISIGAGRQVEENKDFILKPDRLKQIPPTSTTKKPMIPRYVFLYLGAIAVGYVASRVIK